MKNSESIGYQEFKDECTKFFKFLNEQKMDAELKRKATVFYNKVVYSFNMYSLALSFYTIKLQEAQRIILNSRDPAFLKNEMDRLNNETIQYINDPLGSKIKCAIGLQILMGLIGIVIVASGIAAAIVAAPLITKAMIIKGGVSLIGSVGLFAYFRFRQKNIEQEIHTNTLVMKESSSQKTIA